MKFQQSSRGSNKIFALFICPESKTFAALAARFPPREDYWCFPFYRLYLHTDHTADSFLLVVCQLHFYFHLQDFDIKISSRDGNDRSERRENSEREKIFLMKKIIVATAEENKYFVRDIYFISGIIYDFQMRYNFSFRASHSTRRSVTATIVSINSDTEQRNKFNWQITPPQPLHIVSCIRSIFHRALYNCTKAFFKSKWKAFLQFFIPVKGFLNATNRELLVYSCFTARWWSWVALGFE